MRSRARLSATSGTPASSGLCRALVSLSLLATAASACGGDEAPPPAHPVASASVSVAPTASAKPEPPPLRQTSFKNPGGMWMPSQIPNLREPLEEAGWELGVDKLSSPLAHPLGAVVSLQGCTASFVSKEGLVITNHHCVTGALQHNSKPGQNYSRDGFYAKTRADELWAGPGARIMVTTKLDDVTKTVREGLDAIKEPKKRSKTIEERQKKLVAECEKGRPSVRCSVVSYFASSEFHLVEQLELRDVRLVLAPPEGIGHYGGEIDNFRWPRHTGDFSFYRAYVGKDGKPADFSPDNVPYAPPHVLTIAKRPLQQGDFVAVAGYPGNTDRLRTAADVDAAVSWRYPRLISWCDDFLALYNKIGPTDPELGIKVGTSIRRLDNAKIFFQGLMDGLVKGGVLEAKKAAEKGLVEWAEKNDKPAALAAAEIGKLLAAEEKWRDADHTTWEAVRMSRLLSAAVTIVRLAEERKKADEERSPAYQQRNWKRLAEEQQATTKVYDRRIDLPSLKLVLERAVAQQAKAKGEPSPLVATLLGKGKDPLKDADKALAALYDGTTLGDEKVRLELLEKATPESLAKSKDTFIVLARKLVPAIKAQEQRDDDYVGKVVLLRPKYVGAMRAMAGGRLAPDANGTLRVTFGTVRGYKPKPDAPEYRPFSLLSEVVAKHTGKVPFDAPELLRKQAAAKAFGPYEDLRLGDVPVDFLADLDITGGNSGSPTINGKGELVGLVFDGNYEAMAADWVFLPELARSIHVDIRYVLWTMDAVLGADRVLEELGVKPQIP